MESRKHVQNSKIGNYTHRAPLRLGRLIANIHVLTRTKTCIAYTHRPVPRTKNVYNLMYKLYTVMMCIKYTLLYSIHIHIRKGEAWR
jgi:hypothetical protein